MNRSPLLLISWLLIRQLPSPALAQDNPAQPGAVPAKATGEIVDIKENSVIIKNKSGATRTLQLGSVQGLKPGMRTGWCEEDCRVLTVEIPVAAVASVKPSAAEAGAPEARATIVAIKDNTLVIQNEAGATRKFQVESTEGLRPGMRTSWCEDDCRLLSIQAEYRVRQVSGLRR